MVGRIQGFLGSSLLASEREVAHSLMVKGRVGGPRQPGDLPRCTQHLSGLGRFPTVPLPGFSSVSAQDERRGTEKGSRCTGFTHQVRILWGKGGPVFADVAAFLLRPR